MFLSSEPRPRGHATLKPRVSYVGVLSGRVSAQKGNPSLCRSETGIPALLLRAGMRAGTCGSPAETPVASPSIIDRVSPQKIDDMKPHLLLFGLCSLASAQFYNITTVAGKGLLQFSGGGQAVNAAMIEPTEVAVDASGNMYVSDTYFNQVLQVTPGGVINVYAGNGQPGLSGDGGPATAAQLSNPRALAVDSSGNLYIGDTGNYRVRKV